MPLYDDIGSAFDLVSTGGSATLTTTGATLQTNENTQDFGSCGGTAFPGIWVKIDGSSYVGAASAFDVTFTLGQAVGPVLPWLDFWFDPSGTFDPSVPDFTLLTNRPTNSSTGNGTTSATNTTTFNPDVDGNPTGIYWGWFGDYNCTDNTGSLTIDWSAFTPVSPCAGGPAVLSTTLLQTYAHAALIEAVVCPHAIFDYSVRANYGPTAGYGHNTDSVPLPHGTDPVTVRILVSDCGGFTLAASTSYHYRVEIVSFVAFGTDQTFTTDAESVPINDNISNATLISGAIGSIDGDNTAATLEGGEGALLYDVANSIYDQCTGGFPYGGGRTIWYRWIAPQTMDVAFWTGPVDDCTNGPFNLGGNGLCDTFVTILDGTDFATANVLYQNEFPSVAKIADGGTRYSWSLSQFHAESGNTYWIAVDGYNGTAPGAGGYDIANTFQGPFTLHWQPAICEQPAVRNVSVLSTTFDHATIQMDIFPNSPMGATYWGEVTNGGTTDGPHFTTTTTYGWETVTATVGGLIPNTLFFGATGYATNDCLVEGLCTNHTHFCTQMAPFGGCLPLVEDFTGQNCIRPMTLLQGDGIRIEGNEGAVLETTASRHRSYVAVTRPPGICVGIDAELEITHAYKQQELGLGINPAFTGYVARIDHDTSRLEIFRLDSAFAEVSLYFTTVSFSDGDLLGVRYTNGAFSVYKNKVLITTAADTMINMDQLAWLVMVGMSANVFTTDFLSCMPTTDDMGKVTSVPLCCVLCAIGSNKYDWNSAQWLFTDPLYGQIRTPPISSGSQFTTCPGWFAEMGIFPHGQFDCPNEVWGLGNIDGVDDNFYGYFPWLISSPTYDGILNAIEAAHSFFVFDGDYAHKIFNKIVGEAIPALLACDAEAAVYDGTAEGFPNAYEVWRPVDVSPGRVDNLRVGFGNCGFGPVGFHARLH